MLYYQTEIKPFDPNSEGLVGSIRRSYGISRAFLDKDVFGKWRLIFYLTPFEIKETTFSFTLETHVYDGHDGNEGLLKLMGFEIPTNLDQKAVKIFRLYNSKVKTIDMIVQKNGLRALYLPNSKETIVE